MTIIRRAWIGDLELTDYPYGLAFGADMGNPESESVTLESLLADGQIESLTRRLNRSMSIGVIVDGADLADIQANEAALVAECDRWQNTFTLDLGDGYAEPMVFETTLIEPQRVTGDGSDEADMANLHQWTLSIKAQPFWRTATKIVDNAGTPPSGGGTQVSACETTTGWSNWDIFGGFSSFAVDSVIFSEGAGSLRSAGHQFDGDNQGYTNFDAISGLSVATGTGGYLSTQIRTDYTLNPAPTLRSGLVYAVMSTSAGDMMVGNGYPTAFTATSRDANGFVRYVWPVPAGITITAIKYKVAQFSNTGFSGRPNVNYDDIRLLPAATTDHQIVKQLDVKGSARTVGSLHVATADDSVALGKVLAITAPTDDLPAGFTPDGRRWITQGLTTADTSTPDGSYFTPDATTYATTTGKPIFDVPVNNLTAGPYTMVAFVKVESSPTVAGVQAQLRIGSTNVGPTSTAEVSASNLTTGWQFIALGTCYLPPLPMESADSSAKVRLLFKGAKMSNVYMIPAWQVGGRQVADFSIIDCGTGTVAAGGASSNLWIDSPSTDQPQGGWWRGPTADRANAQSAWPDAKKPGIHAFRPGGLTAFLVASGAQGPTLALEYFDRYL